MTLCVFLQTGRTFTFKSVEIVHDNESVLVFTYKAMSDGKVKRGTFQKQIIAGWATA